ncbi:MAG: PTS sugar transporter subunit IIA [Xanthomonadales bacterium]|nr:PTS sugar transporter subunit IIA [Xanthomonadales bacterium]
MLDSDLLSPPRILANVSINSKKRLLELISLTLAKKNTELNSREIFQSLCAREHLGNTTLGNGVAMPHGRIHGTEDVEAIFLRLVKPLELDADDGQPVDLVFALVVPEQCTDDHTKLLESIAERFGDAGFVSQLREAEDNNELWQLLANPNT